MLVGQRGQELVLIDQATRQRNLAGGLAGALALFEDVPELVFVDEAKIDQDLSEAAAAAAGLVVLDRRSLGRRLLGRGRLFALAFFAVAGVLRRWLATRRRRLTASRRLRG